EKVDLNDPRVPELERLVLHWIAEKDNQIRAHIGTFDFGKIASLIHSFCNIELSSFYFDIRKDRLYCDRSDLFERRAARTVMAHLFEALVTWLAPILPFTCEEAWGHRPPDVFGATQSVHLRVFPDVPESWKNSALAEKWAAAALIRKVVLGALELKRTAKTIGSSLEAAPEIYVSNVFEECCPSTKGKLTALQSLDWAEICITSGASFADRYDTDDTFSLREVPGVHVRFKDSGGDKCARCWKVLPDVGTDADHPGVCPRCADAVRAHAADQKAA
ncbi:MAG TPA: class I tRNA ligase family protein, partial [Alphaproteobacteria bacterium]|nr:class I tRNA ligase family protein [Alphaproteobacteria bacterium]